MTNTCDSTRMPRCSHKACDLAATAHKPCHYRNLIFEGARGYSSVQTLPSFAGAWDMSSQERSFQGVCTGRNTSERIWMSMVLCNHSQLLSQSSHVCFIDFSSVDYVQKMFLRLYTYIIIYIYTEYRWFPGCGYPTEADQPSKLRFP